MQTVLYHRYVQTVQTVTSAVSSSVPVYIALVAVRQSKVSVLYSAVQTVSYGLYVCAAITDNLVT